MSPRRRSSLARRVGLALASMLVSLLLAELVARAVGPFEGPRFPLETRSAKGLGVYDPLLFWSLQPSALGDDGFTRTNALGLRGAELPPKREGEHRLLVLGESSTFGWEVREDEIYTAHLQRAFDARDPQHTRVRVVNAGIPGYTSFQGLQYLRHRGLALQPDSVLFMFGINDFLPVSYLDLRMRSEDATQRGLDDAALFAHRMRPAFRLRNWLLQHSQLARAIDQLRRPDDDASAPPRVQTDEQRPRVPKAQRQAVLTELAELCAQNGLRLVIAVPWYRHFREHIWLLRHVARELDVELVDLTVLRISDAVDDCFLDVAHPNPEGHRRIAETLFPPLSELIP